MFPLVCVTLQAELVILCVWRSDVWRRVQSVLILLWLSLQVLRCSGAFWVHLHTFGEALVQFLKYVCEDICYPKYVQIEMTTSRNLHQECKLMTFICELQYSHDVGLSVVGRASVALCATCMFCSQDDISTWLAQMYRKTFWISVCFFLVKYLNTLLWKNMHTDTSGSKIKTCISTCTANITVWQCL